MDCIYLNGFLFPNFSTTLNLVLFIDYWHLLADVKDLRKFYRRKFNNWTHNLIFSLNWEKTMTAWFWEGTPILHEISVQELLF